MTILDTNVLSEVVRPAPEPRVLAWLGGLPMETACITAITVAELLQGVALMPAGKRRTAIFEAVNGLIVQDFADRILPFDEAAALQFADLTVDRKRVGRPISAFDAQIAAIARVHGAELATRNIPDFERCGLSLIDPWKA